MADNVPPASDRYVVVARRYRPRGFSQLVGQDHVSRALANAIETGRIGHAYLFTGARGTGKTSTARIFAKALNAPEGPTISPDNSSDICQAIDAGEDIDVLEIDGASNRGIDEIRQLRAGVGVRPSRARFKIYIIDEVHMLTQQAFNALLKTLEEPPEHVKFIFCTTDPEKLPITVLSRCQRFDFAPVRVDAIAGRLREIVDAEGATAEDEALRLLARRAAGSMRDSQSLLEQVMSFSGGKLTVELVHSMLGTADDARMGELADALAARDCAAALNLIDEAILGGVDAGQLSEQLLGFFRDMMTAVVGCDAEMLRFTSASMHERLREQGGKVGLQTILGIVALLDQALVRIRHSVHGQILLEAALVQICSLPDLDAISSLAAALVDGAPPAAGTGAEKKKLSELAVRPGNIPTKPPAALASASPVGSPVGSPAKPIEPRSLESQPIDSPSLRTESSEAVPPRADLTSSIEWDGDGAKRIWQAALATLDDMTADFARQAETVEAVGANRLRLVFAENRDLAKRSCEKPERKSKLEEALKTVSARNVLIEFVLSSVRRVDPIAAKPSGAVNRRQRMRDAEQHPLVRQLIEMFGAEIVRVDDPHP